FRVRPSPGNADGMVQILTVHFRLCGGPMSHCGRAWHGMGGHTMTIGRLPRAMGLVGSRAYEVQAQRSPGGRALDMAGWESADATPAERTAKSLLARLRDALGFMRAVEGRIADR